MGGIGSGRRWHFSAKHTTEQYRSIDVRWLKRRGLISSGVSQRITWSSRGEVVASIDVTPEPGSIVLTYRHSHSGNDGWKEECYPVLLTTTPCHIGGERHWFLCPVRGCGKRVAVLYGGAIFACRNCHQLAYPSQREHASDRSARRADKIRDRLGWPGGIIEGSGWGKPPGMHWRTYQRLCVEHDVFADRSVAAFIQRFGALDIRDLI